MKDGAASAIYGTRGSNGVILITTKKGSKDGSIHTSYTGTFSFDVMKKELDMLTAQEYRDLRSDSSVGYDLGGNDDWLDAVSQTGFSMAAYADFKWRKRPYLLSCKCRLSRCTRYRPSFRA